MSTGLRPSRAPGASGGRPPGLSCLILAGGLGTRVRALDPERPKALLEVAGRPFADWQLRWLAAQGVEQVVYAIGYRGDQIRAFVDDGAAWGLAVTYVEEPPQLLGTGGATRLAVASGAVGGPFLLLYGDSYLQLDVAEVVGYYRRSGHPALMTVLENHDRWGASNVDVEGPFVVAYGRRPQGQPRPVHIDYGLSVLDAGLVVELLEPGTPADLAQLFGPLIERRLLGAYEVGDRFYEIGTPAGRAELDAHLRAPARGPTAPARPDRAP